MATGKHFGEVGGSGIFNLILTYKREFNYEAIEEGDREYSRWLHKFVDEWQNVAIWWGSCELHRVDTPERKGDIVELEECIEVEARVKDHSVYEGINQTVLTHVAEVSTPEAKRALKLFRKERKLAELIAAEICPECKGLGKKRGKICGACQGGW